MLAAYHDRLPAVRLLLARGADPDQRDVRGQTPLAGVAFKGLLEVAHYLVEGGADIDAPAHDGRTPLGVAAAFNRVEMVRWLLSAGADAQRRDLSGARPVDMARALGAADAVICSPRRRRSRRAGAAARPAPRISPPVQGAARDRA